MMDKHSATITGIIDGEPFAVHIDGIPDQCFHTWDGPAYYVTASGKRINYKTHLHLAGYVDSHRQRVIHDIYSRIDDPIVQSGATCSKCNKEYEPPIF